MNICAAAPLPSPGLEVLERKSQADAPVAREGSKIVWSKLDRLNIERFSRITMAVKKFISRPPGLSIFFLLTAGRTGETICRHRRKAAPTEFQAGDLNVVSGDPAR
jgi:hypothetical protein